MENGARVALTGKEKMRARLPLSRKKRRLGKDRRRKMGKESAQIHTGGLVRRGSISGRNSPGKEGQTSGDWKKNKLSAFTKCRDDRKKPRFAKSREEDLDAWAAIMPSYPPVRRRERGEGIGMSRREKKNTKPEKAPSISSWLVRFTKDPHCRGRKKGGSRTRGKKKGENS